MIKITLEDINRKSPYEITLNNGDFDFTTDSGTRYSVSFLEDVPLGGCDTYQFGFRKREDTHSGYDAHVKDALIAIKCTGRQSPCAHSRSPFTTGIVLPINQINEFICYFI